MLHPNCNPNQICGIIKQVTSADSLIIRSRVDGISSPTALPTEWHCRLSGLHPPDNKYICSAAQEYLRRRLVARDAVLSVESNVQQDPVVGTLYLSETDGCLMSVNAELVLAGLALATCSRLAGPEAEARQAGRGIWGGSNCTSNNATSVTTPSAGQVLTGVLERVDDAANWRVQLGDNNQPSTLVSFRLYGVAAPLPGEPYHEAARFFVEARLLQKRLRLVVCDVSSDGEDFGVGRQRPLSHSGRFRLTGWVPHPSGCISELLVRKGLARHREEYVPSSCCSEAACELADCLRAAEASARAEARWIWSGGATAELRQRQQQHHPALAPGQQIDGTVVEIRNGNGLVVRPGSLFATSEVFIYLRLAHIQPPTMPAGSPAPHRPLFEVPHLLEARELLRSRLLGRRIIARLVGPGEASLSGGSNYCLPASVRIVGESASTSDPAEALLRAGLAYLATDSNCQSSAPTTASLRTAEADARSQRLGVYAASQHGVRRVVEDLACRGGQLAARRLPELMAAGPAGLPAIVEFVAAADRFRIFLPDRALLAGFRLAGVACPQPPKGRDKSVGGESGWQPALHCAKELCHQRDVKIFVSSSDSGGNLIGQMALPQPDGRSLADVLVERGFARRIAPNGFLPACGGGTNAGSAAAAAAPPAQLSSSPPLSELCIVCEVKPDGLFFVQLLKDGDTINQLSADLQAAMQVADSSSGFDPNSVAGGLLAARFSQDNLWYRARLLHPRRSQFDSNIDIRFVDFGNDEQSNASQLAELPAAFLSQPPLSHACRLALVQLPASAPASLQALSEALNSGKQFTIKLLNSEGAGCTQFSEPELWRVAVCDASAGDTDLAESLIERGHLLIDESAAGSVSTVCWLETLNRYRSKQQSACSARLGVWSAASH